MEAASKKENMKRVKVPHNEFKEIIGIKNPPDIYYDKLTWI